MPTYNHAFTLAFAVRNSTDPTGEDITPAQYRAALEDRMDEMDTEGTWEEALGLPFDTYEEGED